jgi:hypothetical protein
VISCPTVLFSIRFEPAATASEALRAWNATIAGTWGGRNTLLCTRRYKQEGGIGMVSGLGTSCCSLLVLKMGEAGLATTRPGEYCHVRRGLTLGMRMRMRMLWPFDADHARCKDLSRQRMMMRRMLKRHHVAAVVRMSTPRHTLPFLAARRRSSGTLDAVRKQVDCS